MSLSSRVKLVVVVAAKNYFFTDFLFFSSSFFLDLVNENFVCTGRLSALIGKSHKTQWPLRLTCNQTKKGKEKKDASEH